METDGDRTGDAGVKRAAAVTRSSRHASEEAELRRRIDWVERHSGHVDFEQVLTGLKIELGYENDFARRVRG